MTGDPQGHGVAAVVLAAGRSERMVGANKLLCEVGGRSLIETVVQAILASSARPVVVVTGHDAGALEEPLSPYPVKLVHNPAYERGLSASLAAGVGALPAGVCGVLICLGDMPLVEADHVESLLERFEGFGEERKSQVCVPTHQGRRGNPVLWGAAFFAELQALGGDRGAKSLLAKHADRLHEVEVGSPGILVDVDTQAALAELEA